MSTTRFRIQGGLYSGPEQWQLTDGTEYIGMYYRYRGGNAFTGASPTDPTTQPLLPYDVNFQIKKTYTASAKRLQSRDFEALTPSTPLPDASDYESGYWTRYFARHANDTNVLFEINKAAFDRWQSSTALERDFYEAVTVQWKLTGKREDTEVAGITIEGVESFNRRSTARSSFADLDRYVGNPLQFTVHDTDLPIELQRKVSELV
jgi:hypothetical protein